MEVLNVVVDQNRALNPEKRRGCKIISFNLREYVALVTIINKVLRAWDWATVAALCVVDHHLLHRPGVDAQSNSKHSKGNYKLARWQPVYFLQQLTYGVFLEEMDNMDVTK